MFLAFLYDDFYPAGGAYDCVGVADTEGAAFRMIEAAQSTGYTRVYSGTWHIAVAREGAHGLSFLTVVSHGKINDFKFVGDEA